MQNTQRQEVMSRYVATRKKSESICSSLYPEELTKQTAPFVSPPQWHLAHCTWFFEKFILNQLPKYKNFKEDFHYLFNSYYDTVGEHTKREERGQEANQSYSDILNYRHHVDEHMEYFADVPEGLWNKALPLLTIGLNHEEQHQELLFMDIKHILYSSSTRRSFRTAEAPVGRSSANHLWFALPAGLFEVGHGSEDFSYDNERPSHKYYHDHSIICGDLVTQQEYLEFIEAGGYQEPKYWLSDGWKYIQDEKITAPLYWEKAGSGWQKFSLSGMQPISANDPVSHVSFYEASAFAEFKKLRLPREQEWELAAKTIEKPEEYFSYDKLWEWTMSPYSPYPGYKKYDGSLGEYNAKFMCNQFVLKGGSFATPFGHSRASYRNFYYPTDRWQFSGFRLAKDEN